MEKVWNWSLVRIIIGLVVVFCVGFLTTHFLFNFRNGTVNHKLQESGQAVSVIPSEITSDTVLAEGTYIAGNITIAQGVTLSVEAGTVINMQQYAKITVYGTLKLIGLEDNLVTLTCENYWNGIDVKSGGLLDTSYASILRMGNSSDSLRITNTGGTVKMNYSTVADMYYAAGDALHFISGNVEINNSNIAAQVNINNSINLILEDNAIDNGIKIGKKPTGIVCIKNNKALESHQILEISLSAIGQNTLENVSGNYSVNNDTNSIIRLIGTPVENLRLSNNKYAIDNLVVPAEITMEVDAGTIIKVKNVDYIIKGVLRLNGEPGKKVEISPFNNVFTHGTYVVESGGLLEATYTDFMKPDTYSSIKNNGALKLNHCHLSWGETISTGTITSENGNVEILNSELYARLTIKSSSSIKLEDNFIAKGIDVQQKTSEFITIKNITSFGNSYPLDISFKAVDDNTFQTITGNLNKENGDYSAVHLYGEPITNVRLLNSTFVLDNLMLPAGITMEVDAGTVIKARNSDYIVKGVLRLNGEPGRKVEISPFGSAFTHGTFIVEAGGVLEATYTDFMKPDTYSSIKNKGDLKLNHCHLSWGEAISTGTITSENGNVEILNSELYARLTIKSSSSIKLEDNFIAKGIEVKQRSSGQIKIINNSSIGQWYPLDISFNAIDYNTFETISANINKEISSNSVVFLYDIPINDIKLSKNIYVMDNFVIPTGITIEVDAETKIQPRGGDHRIGGSLKFNGEENKWIEISPFGSSYYFGTFIIESSGSLEANYTNFLKPNYYLAIENNGYLKLNNSKLSWGETITTGKINSKNGHIELLNSELYARLTVLLSQGIILENNTITNGIDVQQKAYGPVRIINNATIGQWYPLDISFNAIDQNTFQNIRGNYNRENDQNSVIFLKDNPITNVKLTENLYSADNIVIPMNTLVEVDPGATIRFRSGYPTVKGVFYLNGSLAKQVTLTRAPNGQAAASGGHWNKLNIESTGMVLSYNANIEYAAYGIENYGQLAMYNSTLSNCYGNNGIKYNTDKMQQELKYNQLLCYLTSNISIDASLNYWGNEVGPRRLDPTTGSYIGSGYSVSDQINAEGYFTSFVKAQTDNQEVLKANLVEQRHYGKSGVDAYSGNYGKQEIDFTIPNFELSLNRTYNSKSDQYGIFGYGWSFGFSSRLEISNFDQNFYLVYLPNGAVNTFTLNNHVFSANDSRNQLTLVDQNYVLTLVDQTTYTYDTTGKLIRITDPYGNVTTIHYRADGNIDRIVDYRNQTYKLEYNNGFVSKITDPIGRVMTYHYNNKKLETVIRVDGVEVKYRYNNFNKLIEVKENGVLKSEIAYYTSGENSGRIEKVTDELGKVITYTYNYTGSYTTEIDTNLRITKKYYDREGYVYKTIDPDNNQVLITYYLEDGVNKYGEQLTYTDMNGNKTIYHRDDLGRIVMVTNPDLSTKEYTYNAQNSVVHELDEVGNSTQYLYDPDGITLRQIVKPLDGVTTYDASLDASLFELSAYTYYDAQDVNGIKGLVKAKTNEKGITTYTYDASGFVSSKTDGNGNVTTYTNNKLGWVLSETVGSSTVTTTYDQSGNVTEVIKDLHSLSKTEYNSQNKPTQVTDGNGNVELYEYDHAGNVIKKTDKEGNITTFGYDQYGNLVSKRYPNGSSHLYAYDQLNRLIKTYFQDGEMAPVLLEEKSYTKSAGNTIITTLSYIDELTYQTKVETYNFRTQLVKEQNHTAVKTIQYFANGSISSESDPNEGITNYEYTKTGRLEKVYKMVEENQFICTIYAYDQLGRKVEEKVGEQKVELNALPSTYISIYYTYDGAGLLSVKKTSSLEEINYTYDQFQRLSSVTTKQSDTQNSAKLYEYNYLDKLSKETFGDLVTIYTYDLNGNLIEENRVDGKVTKYTYDKNANLLKTIIDDKVLEVVTYDTMGNKIKIVDGNGNITNYEYDLQNRLQKETNPKGQISLNTYDLLGRLISTTDQNQITTTYTYDAYDQVIKKIINEEQIYQYEYDLNGNLKKEISPLGYSTSYLYDKTNQVIQKTDAMNAITKYEYDTLLQLTKEVNAENDVTLYQYDQRGNLIKKSINDLILEQHEYDLLNQKCKTIDGNENVTRYEYNTIGQLVKKQDSLGYTEEYTYHKNGEVSRIVDNANRETLYTYDSFGNVLSKTEQKIGDTETITLSYEYDLNGNLIKETDGNGNSIEHTYDCLNNRIKTKNQLAQETTYEYDNHNNLIKETNYLGNSKTYFYDAYHRLIETKNEFNQIIEQLEYDLNGRQIKRKDANNHTITYIYDKMDNLLETKNELGYQEKKAYDKVGNVISLTDQNGHLTTYEYDARKNLTKVINPLGEVTQYEYDQLNNLKKVTDAKGQVTEYTYDSMNHELTETDALGNREVNEYYQNGQLKKKTTRNNASILYTYDIHGRVIAENEITYVYDNNDNLLELTEDTHKITRVYDKLNRVISKTEDGHTSQYTYGEYTEKTVDPKQNEKIKIYDQAGRLIEVQGEATYLYNLDGTLQKITYANGATEEYQYNDDKTLYQLTNTYQGISEAYQYFYDQNKNIVRKVEPNQTAIYTYDSLNRLKTLSINAVTTTYEYDTVGNRIKETTGSMVKEHIYNAKNQLIQTIEKEDGVQTKDILYTYDLNGNLLTITEDDTIIETNTYDDKNQLLTTTSNEMTSSYTYNAEGLRISKTVGTTLTKFIYEGKEVILELDKDHNSLAKNVYGLSLISRETNQIKGYYLYNGHGDTVTILNQDNEVLNNYEYDVWGIIVSETGDFDNPYKYAGYYYDTETGNYYLLSRYYNPVIARFISEDSYRGELNDSLSLNRYVYVVNNPLIYYDPDGQVPIPLITGAIGGLFGAGSVFANDLWNGMTTGNWKFSSAETYLGATAQGTITGATLGIPGANMLLAGFGGGFAGNIANQLVTTGGSQVNLSQSTISGLTTAVTAGIFSITGQVTTTGLNYVKDYAIRGAFAGVTGDVTYQYLNNGITRNEYGKITGYSFNEAINRFNPLETVKTGIVGTAMAPIGAKILETSLIKWGPQNGIKFGSDAKSITKLNNQMKTRGWTEKNIKNTYSKPYTTRESFNTATQNKATVYYNKDGSYVIVDNITKEIVQISNKFDPYWKPDSNIKNPFSRKK